MIGDTAVADRQLTLFSSETSKQYPAQFNWNIVTRLGRLGKKQEAGLFLA